MVSKKPTRPVLRSTAPDVAGALTALDKAEPPAVESTPPRTLTAHVPLTHFEPPTLAAPVTPATKPANRTANLSTSIAAELRDRIDAIAYEQKLGKTAIVEGALSLLLEGRTNAEIADALRARGQAFKRRT
jgi:hypothetical protein